MLHTYLRWFNFKRRKPYRNTPLIGNPTEVRGFAEPANKRGNAFKRAHFGKYEQKKRRRTQIKIIVAIPLILLILYVLIESVQAIGLFSN